LKTERETKRGGKVELGGKLRKIFNPKKGGKIFKNRKSHKRKRGQK